MLKHLFLCQVDFYDLKPGTKYVIEHYHFNTFFYYVGVFKEYICIKTYFKKIADFDYVFYINDNKNIGSMCCYNEYGKKYYIIIKQKQKIQLAMETRAINKILKHITGDDTFNFY